jgi:hypothetical protein
MRSTYCALQAAVRAADHSRSRAFSRDRNFSPLAGNIEQGDERRAAIKRLRPTICLDRPFYMV